MIDKKVILITGGSDGLGKTIAARLTHSYQVVILSPTPDKVQTAADQLSCDFVVADITDFSGLKKAVDDIFRKYGRIDCLVNSAGVWIQGELDSNDPEAIVRAINVNTLGTIFATKCVLPHMKNQKSGLIVNINSLSGIATKEERSVYVASKFAVTGFTRSIQPELAKYGIGVTGILPGGMQTQMFEKAGFVKDASNFLNPEEVAKTIEFILTLDPTTVLLEIQLKHLAN